jgi:hypothetical protein
MVGLWLAALLLGLAVWREGWWGLLAGGLLALALFGIAVIAGKRVLMLRGGCALFLLFTGQLLLWAGMAYVLAVMKVHPLGFILGASILPVAIIVTLLWYVLRSKLSHE